MFYNTDPRDGEPRNGGLPWDPFKAIVSPRPIGWLTTVSTDGAVNLAPFSYFTAVGDNPNVVLFSAGLRADGEFKGQLKDSRNNAQETGEFVCNVASWELRDLVNNSSASLAPGVSEAELLDIELVPSEIVAPPRVAAAPAALECVHLATYPAPRDRKGNPLTFALVFGEVVGVHIDDRFISEGRLDTTAMQPIARMGYDESTVVTSSFRMTRPDFDLLGHLGS